MSSPVEISRTNPTCLVFLIDQSHSMDRTVGGQAGKKKAEGVADALNRLLQNLVLKCAKADGVRDYFHVGVVGYYFDQVTGDSGEGATLGDFKSRVAGLGPEIGYFFPVGKSKGYVNLKAYWEFAAVNRAEGWNLWLTLALPLAGDRDSSRDRAAVLGGRR